MAAYNWDGVPLNPETADKPEQPKSILELIDEAILTGQLTSDDLIRYQANLRAQVAEKKQEAEIFSKTYKIWDQREKELQKQLEEARRKKAEAANKRDNILAGNKKFEDKISQLEREKRNIMLKELQAIQMAQWSAEVDELTKDRPWRDKAYEHQIYGAKNLAFVKRGFLGDKMGLGKTLTSLIWADYLQAKKILVFAPKETLENFMREIKIWAPDRPLIDLVGKPKMIRDFMLNAVKLSGPEQVFIICINIEAWRKDGDLIPDLVSIKPDAIIIDEAHVIKAKRSVGFTGIRDITFAHNDCGGCGGNEFWKRAIVPPDEPNAWKVQDCWVCKQCDYQTWDEVDICSVKYILPMTGTPILNKPQELWPILFLIDKKSFPREQDFLDDYCVYVCPHGCGYFDQYTCKEEGHKKRWKFKEGGLTRLSEKLGATFIMRDRRQAGIIIPPQTVQIHTLNLSREAYPRQWKAYLELAQYYAVRLNENEVISIPAFIAVLTRFRQMITWPAGIVIKDNDGVPVLRCDVTESVKLDKAFELAVQLIEAGEKVVLFSQFKEPLHELYRRLDNYYIEDINHNIKPVILDGATDDRTKELIKNDFDRKTTDWNNQLFDIALCNYKVGGQSLNFTAASQMIILDQEWNPGKRDQAYARIDRIGQTKETTVHLLHAVNDEFAANDILLIDEFMQELMDEKENLTEGFEGQVKDTAKRFLDMLKKTIQKEGDK